MGTFFMSAAGMGSFNASSLYCNTNKSKTTCRNQTNKKKNKISVKKSISAQGYMIKLANAKKPAQVSNIIRCVRAAANSVKSITGNDNAAANAKRIANAIEKKGKLKISRLKKEEALNRQRQTEKSAHNIKKAALTAKKLHSRKIARKAEERADVANSAYLYKNKEENYVSSPYSSDTIDTGLVVDVCINDNLNFTYLCTSLPLSENARA